MSEYRYEREINGETFLLTKSSCTGCVAQNDAKLCMALGQECNNGGVWEREGKVAAVSRAIGIISDSPTLRTAEKIVLVQHLRGE